MAKDTALTIIYKAEDQATDKAGKIFNRMESEQEQFQKQAFDASHTAQEAQLRDLGAFAEKARAKYAHMGEAYAQAEQAAREKLSVSRAESAGRRATPEIVRQEEELKRIQTMSAKNHEVMLDAEKAYHARRIQLSQTSEEEVEQVGRRQEKSFLERLNSRGGLRMLAGGLIGVAIGHAMIAATDTYLASIAARSASAGGSAVGVAEGAVGMHAAIRSAFDRIPILGGMYGSGYDTGQNLAGKQGLAASARATDERFNALGKTLQATGAAAEIAQAKYLGFSSAQMQVAAAQASARARAQQYGEAVDLENAALADVAQARQLGLPTSAFEARLKAAQNRTASLYRENASLNSTEFAEAARAQKMERVDYARSIGIQMRAAEGQAAPGMVARQTREGLDIAAQFAGKIAQEFAGLDERFERSRNPYWKTDWLKTQTGLGRSVSEEDADKAFQQEQADIVEMQARRRQMYDVRDAAFAGIKRQWAFEQFGFDQEISVRSGLARLAGREDIGAQYEREDIQRRAAHAKELYDLDKNSPEYEQRTGAQELEDKAVVAERARELEQHHRGWQEEAKQAQLAQFKTLEAARDRNLESLRFELSEKERLYGKDKDLESAVAARQAAVQTEYARSARERNAGMLASALQLAGQPAMAGRAEMRARFQREIREAANLPKAQQELLAKMQGAEAEQFEEREAWTPHEIANRAPMLGRRGGIPAGYDNPMIGLGKATRELQETMARMGGTLEKIEAWMSGHGISIVDSFGG